MFKHQIRNAVCKTALFAGIALTFSFSPALSAQTARTVLPGSAAFDALPSSLSPVLAPSLSSSLASTGTTVRASFSSQTFSTIRIPDSAPAKPFRTVSPESRPSVRNWLLLSAVSHSAATFDAYSTRRSIEAGNVEADPLMKPFAGSPAIYVAIQASPLVMDFAALKMQHSGNRFVRRLWWIPQSTGTAMSLFAGVHNLSIAR
jgi:hypothetical protein